MTSSNVFIRMRETNEIRYIRRNVTNYLRTYMKYDEAPSWPLVYRCCTDLEISDGEFSLRPIKWDDRLRTMKWRNGQAKILRNQNRLSESSQNGYFKHSVSIQMLEERPDQILILGKFGYVKEGRLRRHTIIGDDPIDSTMHGLLLETVQHC